MYDTTPCLLQNLQTVVRLAIPHGKAFQQQIATHGRLGRAQVVSHSIVSWSVAPTWRIWFMAYEQTHQRYVSG